MDQLLVGLLEDPQVSDALKEAGVAAARVKAEVDKLRGGDNRRVESASGDTSFQALKKYGRDLVEVAGKLGPGCGGHVLRRICVLRRSLGGACGSPTQGKKKTECARIHRGLTRPPPWPRSPARWETAGKTKRGQRSASSTPWRRRRRCHRRGESRAGVGVEENFVFHFFFEI